LKSTKELLPRRVPLFEAGISAGGIHSRADILVPVEGNAWDIVEVKSSTHVKDVNIHDVAVQKYCYEKAGLKIRRSFLMHINNEYLRDGDIVPEKLIKKEDITDKVKAFLPSVSELVKGMQEVISRPECPTVKLGKHCKKPYDCPLRELCWQELPEHNVTTLPHFNKWDYYLKVGGYSMFDVDYKSLNQKQQTVYTSAKTGKAYFDPDGINSFLAKLVYPLYFLDFETFSSAIPLIDDSKPYQQIPFQYSLHVLDSIDGTAKHHEFLASGDDDPRLEFMNDLIANLGSSGSIIVYNQSFEISRLREVAETFPGFKTWAMVASLRIVDLLEPFRSMYCYHPKQHGSNSIKKVLPAWTDLSYDDMNIADGETAASEYVRVNFGENILPEDKQNIRESLLKYCELDTWAMVVLLRELYNLI
jgi:CRISPR/Cas system-associated exonuclease Cas4 (RecB family)